jgi:hypothetical protein
VRFLPQNGIALVRRTRAEHIVLDVCGGRTEGRRNRAGVVAARTYDT